MVDLDTLVLMTGIATNVTSFVHTLQETRDNPDYGIVGNYRNFMSWAFGGGRNNPSYRAHIPQQLVAIPLSGPGVALGTAGKRLVDYFKRDCAQHEK